MPLSCKASKSSKNLRFSDMNHLLFFVISAVDNVMMSYTTCVPGEDKMGLQKIIHGFTGTNSAILGRKIIEN